MKLTVQQLINSVGVNSQPSAFGRLMALPVKISATLHMKRIVRTVNRLFGDFIEARNDLIKKHGEPVKDNAGNFQVLPTSPGFAAFHEEQAELMALEVEVPGPRFTLHDLFVQAAIDRDEIMVSRSDLDALEWLIDDGVADDVPAAENVVEGEFGNDTEIKAPEQDETDILDLPDSATSATA